VPGPQTGPPQPARSGRSPSAAAGRGNGSTW
jgi:hypothetical protein